MAELWGLRDGMFLAKYLGIKFLSVKLNASIVVNCIIRSTSKNLLLKSIIDDCRNLAGTFEEFQISHMFRK